MEFYQQATANEKKIEGRPSGLWRAVLFSQRKTWPRAEAWILCRALPFGFSILSHRQWAYVFLIVLQLLRNIPVNCSN